MKRIIIFFTAFFLFFILSDIKVYASEINMQSVADELQIETDGLDNNIDNDVKAILEENNITAENTEGISAVTPMMVMEYIVEQIRDKLNKPLKDFMRMMCMIIVCAVTMNFGDSLSNKSLEKIYGIVSAMLAISVVTSSISSCVSITSETLYSGANFMMGYIPVFAGITASSGCLTAAASYSTVLLLIAEVTVRISSDIIMPVLSVCMSLGIIESVNPTFRLTSITEGITKLIKLLLGIIMTVFIGLLSIQSVIGASSDTIGIKAAKYLAANCIPVVGGAVADAYTTLKSSLGILRGGTGFFGIAVIFLTVAPTITELGITRMFISVSEIVSDVMGISSIKTLLKNTSSILSMMLSLVISFSMMLIISTALVMAIGLDVS